MPDATPAEGPLVMDAPFLADDAQAQLSDQEITTAGRSPESLAALRRNAFAIEEISPGLTGFVIRKKRPYTSFDTMLLVVKENGVISGMQDLEPEQLQTILTLLNQVGEVLVDNAGSENPIQRLAFTTNFQKNPVAKEVFGQIVHAQTLPDQHWHITGFRESVLAGLKPLAKTSVEKKALRNIDDPFLNLVERLAKNALLQERMTQGTTNLKLEEDPTLYNRQVNFTVPKTVLTENSFSQDLITLHHNMEAIYNEIAGIFVDVATQPDASGMPQLWSFEERQQRLTAFLSQIDAGFSSEADRRYVSRFMHKINQRLKSGEEVAAQPDQVKKNWPVFLRGFAYTLMVVADPGKTDISVNFLPRVISSGSALEGLGFYRTFKEPPSPAWLAEREEAEAAIRAHFRPEDESLS